jgi:hypothetical protein
MKKKTKKRLLITLAVLVVLAAAIVFFLPVGLIIHTLRVFSIGDYCFEDVYLEKVVFKDTINNYFRSTLGTRWSSPFGFDLSGNKLTDLCINSEDNVIYHINVPANAIVCCLCIHLLNLLRLKME